MFIVKDRSQLTPEIVCAIVLQSAHCYTDVDLSDYEYSIDIDPNRPALHSSKDSTRPPTVNDLTIVHITDPHYDQNYQIGSWADCPETSCCRSDQPVPSNQSGDASIVAGRWGDYRKCDSSLEIVDNVYSQIRLQHQNISFVYFTGDIVDHGIWDTTELGNRRAITANNGAIDRSFAGIPIYPVLGNHEGQPVNIFAPSHAPRRFSTQWLYDFIADEWAKWLPASSIETVRFGGYYTTLVRPGLRVIGVNNNDCSTYNWWLLWDPQMPRAQLQWIHDQLLAAERAGEKVHMLAHTPSGDYSCFKVYGREYRRIVNRFWDTISGQFVGHTHADEFNIFYSPDDDGQAMNVMWNGGSTTAYSDINPNYRIYTVDPQEFQVNGHETWIYNLTLANENQQESPQWFKEYDFIEEYGVDNLSPLTLSELSEELARDAGKLRRVSREGKVGGYT